MVSIFSSGTPRIFAQFAFACLTSQTTMHIWVIILFSVICLILLNSWETIVPIPINASGSCPFFYKSEDSLEPGARMRKIYLPMTSRAILAGIKTSAVINVGTATLTAFIGAGGLGEPIVSGLALNDTRTVLEGAIPSAILALLVQFVFDRLDRLFIPKGLRLADARKE
jgi:ABC-type nitrate/sulfonate/bicarbonate transport system permease component